MNLLNQAVKMVLCMTLLTGIIYPTCITLFAKYFYPDAATGDFVMHKDKIIGARSIGQKFVHNTFFWPRPSACDYNGVASGGSNLGPTSKTLQEIVEARKKHIQETHNSSDIPSELLFSSGSGLDPHIRVETALYQLNRVALARKLDTQTLKNLIETYAEGEYINVLILNNALEEIDL